MRYDYDPSLSTLSYLCPLYHCICSSTLWNIISHPIIMWLSVLILQVFRKSSFIWAGCPCICTHHTLYIPGIILYSNHLHVYLLDQAPSSLVPGTEKTLDNYVFDERMNE